MDSMQELRQEFNTILESYESADTPLTPLQKAERLRRLEEIARKANIECDNTINKAGYTATPVACGWAGAIIEVNPSFGQEQ